MKSFVRWLVSSVIICIFAVTSNALQGGGRPIDSRPSSTAPRETRRPPRRIPRPPSTPTSSNRGVPAANLTVTSHPPNCTIILNGRPAGATNASGQLVLNALRPGQYILITRKTNYRDDQRTIEIEVGEGATVEVSLIALPGTLNVTTNVTDANIRIASMGEYVGQINDLTIAPGIYRIEVSRPGYQAATRSLEVLPGTPSNLSIPLEPLPIEQALTLAEQSLRSRDYNTAIAISEVVLTNQPGNQRATVLTGYGHYYAGRFNQSLLFLLAALSANSQIEIQVKRFQRESSSDALFSGQLVLRRGSIAFQSNERPDFNFSITTDKIYELKTELQKGGRINIRVGISRSVGQRERRERFFFHPSAAFVSRQGRNSSIDCPNCQEELQAIFQLIQRVRQ